VFRVLYPDTVAYTWWNQRFDARTRNLGWRIDLFLATPELLPYVQDCRIRAEVMGSDHCPVELELNLG
jgi:exodeoxyribonuclease-3